jgi:Arc/MetJ-type ribon-helix-helix transcriptional regulator
MINLNAMAEATSGGPRLALSYEASYHDSMAETITIRTDTDTERALDVLTRDGSNRSEAIREAVLEAALRRERLTEMKRAFLRRPMPAPNGVNVAEEIVREREGDAR